MIDYQARSQLAQAARALISGRITNDQFEDRQPNSNDLAIREIFYRGFWPLYSDTSEHRLNGSHRLAAEDRQFAVRCIAFLKSGLPYSWPVLPLSASFWLRIRNVLTLGRAGRECEKYLRLVGDVTLWPFHSANQFADCWRALKTDPGCALNFDPPSRRG